MTATTFNNQRFNSLLHRIGLRRGLVFGLLIVTALLAFEIFNYSTTVFALTDLLGDLKFMGIAWATILAIAFCGIDFAGIARLFTQEEGGSEPSEIWYLFGAWLLAATMNAMLTWWGVSIALLNHESLGNAVVERETLMKVVPIFVAVMVWLIRVLIIGTFSVAGDRLFSQVENRRSQSQFRSPTTVRALNNRPATTSNYRDNTVVPSAQIQTRTAYKSSQASEPLYTRPEPTYHPVSMSARPAGNGSSNRSSNSSNR